MIPPVPDRRRRCTNPPATPPLSCLAAACLRGLRACGLTCQRFSTSNRSAGGKGWRPRTACWEACSANASARFCRPAHVRPRARSQTAAQLRDAPDTLRVEARYPNAKEPVSATLKEVRDHPDRLLFAADPKREPRVFRVALSRELGIKRGRNQGSFVAESKKQALDFYREIVQGLRPWSPSAPRLPGQSTDTTPVASPTPPDFSDETREFGEATQPEG